MDDVGRIDLDESMENCLFNFEDAARSVAARPQLTVDQFQGHFATAWELRQELLDGQCLLAWNGADVLHQCIERLVSAARELPREAWQGSDAQELFHPSWAQVREAANFFLATKGASWSAALSR